MKSLRESLGGSANNYYEVDIYRQVIPAPVININSYFTGNSRIDLIGYFLFPRWRNHEAVELQRNHEAVELPIDGTDVL